MSLANIGKIVTAPPSSTANKSSVIVPRMILFWNTNRKPSARLRRDTGSAGFGLYLCLTRTTSGKHNERGEKTH